VSLRTRLTLAAGGAVLAALAIASLVIYFAVRSKLHDQIDGSLISNAQAVATKWQGANGPLRAKTPTVTGTRTGKLPPGSYERANNPSIATGPVLGTNASGYFQIVPTLGQAAKQLLQGSSATLTPNGFIPLTAKDAAVAVGTAIPYFHYASYDGVAMRVYTARLASTSDGLVRTARPLTEANATIGRIRWLLVALTLGGALAAALLGRVAAATVLRPVRTLAETVRSVTVTRDLSRRIDRDGHDEVASLAGDFNSMLAALDESQQTQQQLIADASHELRTPLTAHRANIELLARPDLPDERRPQALAAAVRAIDELSTLVDDLIAAARDGRSIDTRTTVALDRIVEEAVARAQKRAPALRFAPDIDSCTVTGAGSRIERAVDNILDNAVKWSPPGGAVDVRLHDGTLTVRDRGPGIDEDDLPHVFDRFYRAAAARGLPGSGLGLAIVKQTVDDHGGAVSVSNVDGGGTVVTVRFAALTNL
jgi:two-component system sensor histidine kinase MprB